MTKIMLKRATVCTLLCALFSVATDGGALRVRAGTPGYSEELVVEADQDQAKSSSEGLVGEANPDTPNKVANASNKGAIRRSSSRDNFAGKLL